MIGEFNLPFGAIQDWDWETKTGTLKIAAEKYAALRELLPDLPDDPTKNHVFGHGLIGDFVAVARLIPGVEIRRIIETSPARIVEKSTEPKLQDPGVSFNARCNVHVPGLGLLLIEEVEVHEDACTESLQKKLDEGWRIIACCPQPDQRRPDYILGRSRKADHG